MGFMFMLGSCFSCGAVFSFSAEKVPSIVVEGVRRQICRDCVELANPTRIENGLAPIEILPGAYEGDETI